MSDSPIVVDPRFNLPPGIIDAVVSGDPLDPDQDPVVLEDFTPVSDVMVGPDPGGFIATPPIISAPTSFSVVSQTVRTAPDGQHVVDVIIDVPDEPGVVGIDVRVAKI